MSRTQKTAVNAVVGLCCSVLSSVLSFVLRAVFIGLLGLEYAGINSLFTDVLSILNLADLGFNNAILFRLYRTIADRDDAATEKYLTLYRKICYGVGLIVGLVGLCCIPFLKHLIHDSPSFPEPLWSLFVIILATSVLNHLFSYRSILLIARQDRYIATIIQYGCMFLRNGLQLLALLAFENIYLYLLVSFFTVLLQGILSGLVSNKRYHLSWRSKERISREEATVLSKDVGALSVYKLCRTLDASIDTFLISKFVDVSTTAIYGSFTMLLGALNELFGVFNDGMLASVGDLNAEGNREQLLSVFYQSFHFTFLLFGICTAALAPFLSDFVSWWIGYSLDAGCIYLLLLNFVMYGFGMNVATFRNSMGIFSKGWIRPAVTALLNLVFSLILVRRLGLFGTLLGTLIARVFTLMWYDPWLVIRHGMGKSPLKYYARYLLYLACTALAGFLLVLLSAQLPAATGLVSLLWHGILFAALSAALLLLLGCFIPEQKMILQRIAGLMRQFFHGRSGGRIAG